MATVEQASIADSQLPVRKRKKADEEEGESGPETTPATSEPVNKASKTTDSTMEAKKDMSKRPAASTKAREIRLEQNRKAARESRRRKKVMIEELQRSVIFFSRANGTLKQQNDELTRLLMQAQAHVAAIETAGKVPEAPAAADVAKAEPAPAVAAPAPQPAATQPTSAAAAAMSGSLPPMQPGATMQAMANFQQAAAAAMQAAVQGMKGIPGVSMQSLAAPAAGSGGTNSQQAYNDTMTAIAMQQAAAAASGQPFYQMSSSVTGWQNQAPAAGTSHTQPEATAAQALPKQEQGTTV
mmetsp:Transcript_12811/g.20623  ORF Transcript_12811/g.20623 Transcript_12811/m.20623 type:complete len:297 (+) Transcript_12811:232-1122(+)